MKIISNLSCTLLFAAILSACAQAPLPQPSNSSHPASTPSAQTAPVDKPGFAALLEAAKQGDLIAQVRVSHAFEMGDGIEKNMAQAFDWMGRAANAGYVPAQYFYGAMHASSRGTSLDVTKAIYWYQKAADQGYPDALYPIAYTYENGLGGYPQDYAQAVAWYRKAAETGNSYAFQRLAAAYRNGELGLAVDAEQADVWDKKFQANSKGGKLLSMPVGKQ